MFQLILTGVKKFDEELRDEITFIKHYKWEMGSLEITLSYTEVITSSN